MLYRLSNIKSLTRTLKIEMLIYPPPPILFLKNILKGFGLVVTLRVMGWVSTSQRISSHTYIWLWFYTITPSNGNTVGSLDSFMTLAPFDSFHISSSNVQCFSASAGAASGPCPATRCERTAGRIWRRSGVGERRLDFLTMTSWSVLQMKKSSVSLVHLGTHSISY